MIKLNWRIKYWPYEIKFWLKLHVIIRVNSHGKGMNPIPPVPFHLSDILEKQLRLKEKNSIRSMIVECNWHKMADYFLFCYVLINYNTKLLSLLYRILWKALVWTLSLSSIICPIEISNLERNSSVKKCDFHVSCPKL